MATPITAEWSDFFVASSGVAGALAGLVFVAISINLARIIELPGVAGRAAETVVLLAGTLAGCLVALMPNLSSMELGGTLLMTAVPTWLMPVSIQIASLRKKTYHGPSRALFRFLLLQIATLPAIWAGLALCGIVPGGIAALAAGAILSMLVAMLNAWILLIEILR